MLLTKSRGVPRQHYMAGGSTWLCQPRASRASMLFFTDQSLAETPQVLSCQHSSFKEAFSKVKTVCCIQPYHWAQLICDTSHSTLTCPARMQAAQHPQLSLEQSCLDNWALCGWQAQLLEGISLIPLSSRQATHTDNWATDCCDIETTHYRI